MLRMPESQSGKTVWNYKLKGQWAMGKRRRKWQKQI